MHKITDWLDRLQENGYRLTAPRRAVIESIAHSQRVLTPLELYEQARQLYPKLGLVTVYRTLEKLEDLNLVQRVHRTSDCQAFVSAFSGHQHMLICQQCGRVEFFSGDGDYMGALIKAVGQDSGYQITGHWLQLFGVCENCRHEFSSL